MAGKYIEFLNPGYSTLYTRDLKYKGSSNGSYGESSSLNPFDPDSANPLVEGEWLQYTHDNKLSRVWDSASVQAEAGKNVAKTPCAMYFQEKGRYDAQITKKAHCVSGPNGFDFKTKLCKVASHASTASAGARLFVADLTVGSVLKRGLMDAATVANETSSTFSVGATGGATSAYYWSPGYIQRVISTSEIVVHFDPQLVLVTTA